MTLELGSAERAFWVGSLPFQRQDDYWAPLDGVYRRLPDFGHPLTEAFAIDLHFGTPFRTIADLPAGAKLEVWERQPPALREFFRERARRLIRGDLSVISTYLPPGYGAWQAVAIK